MADNIENQIVSFLHCRKCMEEFATLPKEEVAGISPRDYAQIEVGFMAPSEKLPEGTRGLQIWCKRHDELVITLLAIVPPSMMDTPCECTTCKGGQPKEGEAHGNA